MTLQEAFDKIYTGLRGQEWGQSVSIQTASCAYRGAEGRKCAIGFLIPDDKYLPEMDGTYPWNVEQVMNYLKEDFTDDEILFLCRCQHIHDVHPYEEMKFHLEQLARDHNLTIPE